MSTQWAVSSGEEEEWGMVSVPFSPVKREKSFCLLAKLKAVQLMCLSVQWRRCDLYSSRSGERGVVSLPISQSKRRLCACQFPWRWCNIPSCQSTWRRCGLGDVSLSCWSSVPNRSSTEGVVSLPVSPKKRSTVSVPDSHSLEGASAMPVIPSEGIVVFVLNSPSKRGVDPMCSVIGTRQGSSLLVDPSEHSSMYSLKLSVWVKEAWILHFTDPLREICSLCLSYPMKAAWSLPLSKSKVVMVSCCLSKYRKHVICFCQS